MGKVFASCLRWGKDILNENYVFIFFLIEILGLSVEKYGKWFLYFNTVFLSAIIFYFFICFVFNKIYFNKCLKRQMIFVSIFSMYFILLNIFRILYNQFSIDILTFAVATYPTIALIFLITLKKTPTMIILKNIIFCSLIVSITQLCYFYYINSILHLWYFPVSSFMLNSNIVNCFLVASLPLCYIFIYLSKKNKLHNRLASGMSYSVLFLVPIVISLSGTRMGFALTTCFFIIGLLISIRDKMMRVKYFIITSLVICSIIILGNTSNCSFFIYKSLNINTSNLMNAVKISGNNVKETMANQNPSSNVILNESNSTEIHSNIADNIVIISTEENNDGGRFTLWRLGLSEIKKNIFTGTGKILYAFKTGDQISQPMSFHNFILEIMVSIGAIGLILYATVIINPILSASRVIVKSKGYTVLFMLLLSVSFILSFSLFEPFVMVNIIVMLLWVIISTIYNVSNLELSL